MTSPTFFADDGSVVEFPVLAEFDSLSEADRNFFYRLLSLFIRDCSIERLTMYLAECRAMFEDEMLY